MTSGSPPSRYCVWRMHSLISGRMQAKGADPVASLSMFMFYSVCSSALHE